jgi:hypothetical protein
MEFLRLLLVGPFPDNGRKLMPALERQREHLQTVWSNSSVATFGIERLFRLYLVLVAYLFPGIYIRHVAGKFGVIGRKISLDVYVTLKILFPIGCLYFGFQNNAVIQFLVLYFAFETLMYVAGLLFLSDIYRPPISQKRSYLLFMMNYVEITLAFSVIYSGRHLLSRMIGGMDAVYFSFVTGFTIGYGDVTPIDFSGKILVIVQSLCSLFFVTLAISKAVGSFDQNTAKPANNK